MDAGSAITYSGDWEKLRSFLKLSWKDELYKEINLATKRSALHILSSIRKRIHDREYAANALSTALKKGFKSVKQATPLVDSGNLIRKALAIAQKDETTWEVGVLSDVKAGSGSSMFDIVPILHEGGTFTVRRGKSKAVIRIPPRPFLRAVFEDPEIIKYVNTQWEDAIKIVLKRHGKL